MLDQRLRETILQLHRNNKATRRIARLVQCSRVAVYKTIAAYSAAAPAFVRGETADRSVDRVAPEPTPTADKRTVDNA